VTAARARRSVVHVTDQVGAPGCDDYEYDLVHDDLPMPGERPAIGGQRLAEVDVRADEGGGDYGYDLAHDMR
jgi:hypothetical protein